jgi:ADP-heptose:LPS heptosyltransferase
MSQTKPYLFVSSQRLGDVVFTTPCFVKLREIMPEAVFDVVAHSTVARQALQNNPYIRQTFLASDFDLVAHRDEYDAILPMINNSYVREYLAPLDDVDMIEPKPDEIHWIDYFWGYLQRHFPALMAHSVDHYELYPGIEDDAYAKKTLQKLPEDALIIAMHMGTNRSQRYGKHILKRLFNWKLDCADSKCWPFDNFQALMRRIQKAYPNAYFVLTGSPSEAYLIRYIKDQSRVINLIGKTSVLQLAAVLSRSDILITGDTGPLHVACAMKTPLIGLYGRVPPSVSGPRPICERNQVIHDETMASITVAEVFERFEKMQQVAVSAT